MLPNEIIRSKQLKSDLEKTVQYELAHLLRRSMLVSETSSHFVLEG